jgi:hypothetical protein
MESESHHKSRQHGTIHVFYLFGSDDRAIMRANMARLRLRRNLAGSIRANFLRLTKTVICAEQSNIV